MQKYFFSILKKRISMILVIVTLYNQWSDLLIFDLGGDIDDYKSTFGHVFWLIYEPLVWLYMKKKVVSLSTTKSDYRETINACIEKVWIPQLLEDIGFPV